MNCLSSLAKDHTGCVVKWGQAPRVPACYRRYRHVCHLACSALKKKSGTVSHLEEEEEEEEDDHDEPPSVPCVLLLCEPAPRQKQGLLQRPQEASQSLGDPPLGGGGGASSWLMCLRPSPHPTPFLLGRLRSQLFKAGADDTRTFFSYCRGYKSLHPVCLSSIYS